MPSLGDIFGETGHVGAAQECARALVIFVYGLAIVRVAGRRVFGKWSALDIIVSIIVGSNLSRALTGSAALFGTMAATAVLMAVHWVLARMAAQWPAWSRLLEGQAIELSQGGSLSHAVQRHAISEADLSEALRQSGLENAAAARRITLEPSGRITVLKGK
jgi:uncharacterized membrane protein YcaP (DUF421 family)